MKRARISAAALLLAVGAVITGTTVANATQQTAPAAMIFDKTFVGSSTFAGTATGSIDGALTSTWLNPVELGAHGALPVRFLWEVDGDHGRWAAELKGKYDQATGAVTMAGVVGDGPYKGCRVDEQGQLVDPLSFRFVGMITIDTKSC